MSRDITDRCLALAGIYQAACLVHDIARGRTPDATAMEASLASVFVVDAATTAEVFGGVAGVRAGLESLAMRLAGRVSRDDLQPTRYAIALMHLERRLARRPDLLERLRQGIGEVRRQLDHFGTPTHPSVISGLAGLYQETLSTLTPRIMVTGDPGVLQQTPRQEEVRALLLAGMRAAVLWHQCGGRRWHVLFRRGALLGAARTLLAAAADDTTPSDPS